MSDKPNDTELLSADELRAQHSPQKMDDYDKFCMLAVISMGAALLMLPLMFLIGTIFGAKT